MYESHFGFSGSPFQLNPDPAFYFDSRGHSNALAYLKFGAHQGEGFIVVTGEIGAGKTTLVRTLLEGLNPAQVLAAQVVSTQLESSELLQAILMAFGVPSSNPSKAHLIATLEGFLTALAAQGRRALLIIDEAQNLRHEAVEELRMLSNFQLGKYGLLQSFLVGQPELRGLLQSKSMEQLRQRVIASCHLGPLDPTETRAYVEHRLRRVGWTGQRPVIPTDVLDRIHYWTGGVPRRINRLCNRLLLGAFLANASTLTVAMTDETALELRNEIGEASGGALSPQPAQIPAAPAAEPNPAVAASVGADAEPLVVAPAPATATPPAGTPVRLGPSESPAADEPSRTAEPVQPSEPPTADQRALQHTEQSSEPPIAQPATRRTVQFAATLPDDQAPLVCLVDSVADVLCAGLLANVFRSFPSLPPVVALNTSDESALDLADVGERGMHLPQSLVHLGIAAAPFGPHASQVIQSFDAFLSEMAPTAVLVFGSSDVDLACSLAARKRGVKVLRAGSGRRDANRRLSSQLNAVLIERIADAHYTDSNESLYALFREGIRLDRVHSVGNLAREALHLTHASCPQKSSTPVPIETSLGLITIDPRVGFDSAQRLTRLAGLLCDLAQEAPLTWLLHPDAHQMIHRSGHADALTAAGVRLVAASGHDQACALAQSPRCVISVDEGPWLEEAKALGIPALALTEAFVLEPVGLAPTQQGEPAAPADPRASLLARLNANVEVPTPEYWHSGAATRIATQLVTGLPRSASTSPARPQAPAIAA
jgi:putative secretion ATPase (PEP-CTERM system associated)